MQSGTRAGVVPAEYLSNAAEEPIPLPGSPFLDVLKSFGRDELTALLFSTVGTVLVSPHIHSALVLAFAGPAMEKIGFFPWHIYESLNLRKTTPKAARKRLGYYLKLASKKSLENLIADVFGHDPTYILLFFCLSFWPGIPVWLTSAASFIVAVAIVAAVKVAMVELQFKRFGKKLADIGFERESYLEARFVVRTAESPESVKARLMQALELNLTEDKDYEDVYFETNLPCYNGRKPRLRLRERSIGSMDARWATGAAAAKQGKMRTLQVIYSRSAEEQNHARKTDQFRFFPIRKVKFYRFLDAMPTRPDEVGAGAPSSLIQAGSEVKKVNFRRTVLANETGKLLATMDAPSAGSDHLVIELKARHHKKDLILAMRTVMLLFQAEQTTVSKADMKIF